MNAAGNMFLGAFRSPTKKAEALCVGAHRLERVELLQNNDLIAFHRKQRCQWPPMQGSFATRSLMPYLWRDCRTSPETRVAPMPHMRPSEKIPFILASVHGSMG
jgi:hypothetical protein